MRADLKPEFKPELNSANTASVLNHRTASESFEPDVLADIYDPTKNMVIWQRQLDERLLSVIDHLFAQTSSLRIENTVSPDTVYETVHRKLEDYDQRYDSAELLSRHVTELVDMFCCLFEVPDAGLRMTMLEHAMCPRFHVDRVPCRLVSTFQGSGTQWLPHHVVDRSKLGHGNNGLPDHESGIYTEASDICQLSAGDVALLKGSLWEGNEHAGLVHRSPALKEGEKRLLITLDFVG